MTTVALAQLDAPTPPPRTSGLAPTQATADPAVVAGRVMYSRTRHIVSDRLRDWQTARTAAGRVTTDADRMAARADIWAAIAAEFRAIQDGRPDEATPGVRLAYGIAIDSVRRTEEYAALVSPERHAIEGGKGT